MREVLKLLLGKSLNFLSSKNKKIKKKNPARLKTLKEATQAKVRDKKKKKKKKEKEKKKKKKKNFIELRYDLIPFGYVGSLVFVTKFSHICT